jgi:peroxiredoxin
MNADFKAMPRLWAFDLRQIGGTNFADVAILAACLCFLSFSFGKAGFREKTISNFTLKNVDGKLVSLSKYSSAKGFVVVFTCNHCPFAKLYTKRLNDLNTKFNMLGVPLLAINSMDTTVYQEENFAMMRKKAKDEQFNFPYLYDRFQTVGKDFEADRTPHAFVIWKENGLWKIKYSGAIDDNGAEAEKVQNAYVAKVVKELLQGKPVSEPETSSLGCKISYRK